MTSLHSTIFLTNFRISWLVFLLNRVQVIQPKLNTSEVKNYLPAQKKNKDMKTPGLVSHQILETVHFPSSFCLQTTYPIIQSFSNRGI